jgi:IS5 family transposase
VYPSNFTTRQQTRAKPRPFAELQAVFEALPDNELLEALQATRWTGRPGYPIRAMWRSLVASFFLGIVHDTDLIRALQSNPLLAEACGIDWPDDVPSKFAYCRFRKKLVGFSDLVASLLTECVSRLREALPNFGQTIAVDSTDIKAWANSFHQETDPDAGSGAKGKSIGTWFWYGYKVHLAADADSELPVWFTVTAANVYDGRHLPPVLNEARSRFDWFRPAHVLADKGYDSAECFQYIGEVVSAIPVIDVRKQRLAKAREARPCEAIPQITPRGIRYTCKRLPYDPKCPRFGRCPMLPVFVDSPLNQIGAPIYERYAPFPYGSRQWKALYNKRVSVERVFGRLKGYRKLDALRTRRLPKVWLHVALSVLAMNGSALARVMAGEPESVRECARKVA